jgi:hypothetical protein
MDETEKQRQRTKNLLLFDAALTDAELEKPIPNNRWVIAALVIVALGIFGWIAWHW